MLTNTTYFREFLIVLFCNSIDYVVAVVTDNCNKHRGMAGLIGPNVFGYHSHRFNLADNYIILVHEPVVDTVKRLLKNLSYQIPAANIRRLADLRARNINDTRCSSTPNMQQRFQGIKVFITSTNYEDIQYLISDQEHQKQILALCNKLQDIDTVNKYLQKYCITLSDAHILFDAVMSRNVSTKSSLKQASSTVKNPIFERSIIEVQNENKCILAINEKKSNVHLKRTEFEVVVETHENYASIFSQSVLKRRKTISH